MQIELTNSSKKLCVIGDPVLHSKSPLLHNAMCQALGLDYVYLCQPLAPEDLPRFLDAAKVLGYAGFNATMPFKEALVPYLDYLDPLAEQLGAVNTVCIRDGAFYGYNTDCPGYVAALRKAGFSPQGKTVLLLGAGGAAGAVALGLAQAGAGPITVANRTLAKAQRTAALCGPAGAVIPLSPVPLAQAAAKAELIVNCTSLGMEGQGEWEDLSFLDAAPPGALVSDLIYHPAQTRLLSRAQALGHPTMNGLPLLLHQAILALERFTGRPAPLDAVLPILEELLAQG